MISFSAFCNSSTLAGIYLLDVESFGSRLTFSSQEFGLRNFSWRWRQTATALLTRCQLEKYSRRSRKDDASWTCVARVDTLLTLGSSGEIAVVTSVRFQSLESFQRRSGPSHHKRLSISSCLVFRRDRVEHFSSVQNEFVQVEASLLAQWLSAADKTLCLLNWCDRFPFHKRLYSDLK